MDLLALHICTHTHTQTHTHTHCHTAHSYHCMSTPSSTLTHFLCFLHGRWERFCVVRSPLKLSSAPPRPWCQSLNLEKCQWAQWAGRAGRCVTAAQTDTNTSAALIISNLPERKSEREDRGERETKDREREPGCQIGKHLSSISVTTASLTASVAMATGDCQGILEGGMVRKSAAVTYFRRGRNGASVFVLRCLAAVSLHYTSRVRW